MDDGEFLSLSDSEAEFLDDMDNLLEEFQEMLEKYREHAGLTVEITLEGDEEEEEHAA
jgi:hypothetical protein